MVQLLTWEWLARDILFQLANDRCIGLPWRRSGRVMVYWMSRDTTTIWDWDWTAWESPRPVHCIHTSRAFVSTSGLKKEFKGKREIDSVFPCHGGEVPLPSLKLAFMGVSKNRGTPKWMVYKGIGFSLINHPFWGTPIFGNTHILYNHWQSTPGKGDSYWKLPFFSGYVSFREFMW